MKTQSRTLTTLTHSIIQAHGKEDPDTIAIFTKGLYKPINRDMRLSETNSLQNEFQDHLVRAEKRAVCRILYSY